MEATIKQISKCLSPNNKRNYYAVQLECPTCHNNNTHIFYNINKPIGTMKRCEHNDCNKYILPIQQIQDYDKTLTEDEYTDYHIITYDYGRYIHKT